MNRATESRSGIVIRKLAAQIVVVMDGHEIAIKRSWSSGFVEGKDLGRPSWVVIGKSRIDDGFGKKGGMGSIFEGFIRGSASVRR